MVVGRVVGGYRILGPGSDCPRGVSAGNKEDCPTGHRMARDWGVRKLRSRAPTIDATPIGRPARDFRIHWSGSSPRRRDFPGKRGEPLSHESGLGRSLELCVAPGSRIADVTRSIRVLHLHSGSRGHDLQNRRAAGKLPPNPPPGKTQYRLESIPLRIHPGPERI